MEKDAINTIAEILEKFMEKMGFSARIEVKKPENGETETLECNIIVDNDSNLLIGQHGVNLQSLQHIVRLLVRKKIDEKINFIIDVNSYRAQKNQTIIEQAKTAAEQAANEKRAVILRPMSAYERRLVHLELSKDNRVSTESIGEEENRKVMIKPKSFV